MGTIVEFADSLGILVRAYFLRAAPFGVAMIPVFALSCFVGRAAIIIHTIVKASLAVLLVIGNPASLQNFSEAGDPIPIAGIESVPPECPHFPISHLLGFLYLLGVELDLSGVDSIGPSSSVEFSGIILISWLHVTVIVVIVLVWRDGRRILVSSLSVLLGDS